MYISGLLVRKSELQLSSRDCFLGGENMDLLFNSDIMNLLLKTNGERGPNFVIFVVWDVLIING